MFSSISLHFNDAFRNLVLVMVLCCREHADQRGSLFVSAPVGARADNLLWGNKQGGRGLGVVSAPFGAGTGTPHELAGPADQRDARGASTAA